MSLSEVKKMSRSQLSDGRESSSLYFLYASKSYKQKVTNSSIIPNQNTQQQVTGSRRKRGDEMMVFGGSAPSVPCKFKFTVRTDETLVARLLFLFTPEKPPSEHEFWLPHARAIRFETKETAIDRSIHPSIWTRRGEVVRDHGVWRTRNGTRPGLGRDGWGDVAR
jgi:hypothetical protein